MRGSWTGLICLAVLPLAACGGKAGDQSEAGVGNGTATSESAPAAAVADSAAGTKPKIKPGLWESTTEILEMKMDGAPAAAAGAFKPTKTVARNCVTPEEASAEVPHMEKPEDGGHCDFTKRDWSGGTIDIAMACTGPNGEGRTDISSTGRYDDTSFTMDNRAVMAGPGGMKINSHVRISSKYVGACTG